MTEHGPKHVLSHAPHDLAGDVKGLPLSSHQRRLWFLDQLDPMQPTYNMPFTIQLEGKLDLDRLERAVGAFVDRHQPLRTAFVMDLSLQGTDAELAAGPLADDDAFLVFLPSIESQSFF